MMHIFHVFTMYEGFPFGFLHSDCIITDALRDCIITELIKVCVERNAFVDQCLSKDSLLCESIIRITPVVSVHGLGNVYSTDHASTLVGSAPVSIVPCLRKVNRKVLTW